MSSIYRTPFNGMSLTEFQDKIIHVADEELTDTAIKFNNVSLSKVGEIYGILGGEVPLTYIVERADTRKWSTYGPYNHEVNQNSVLVASLNKPYSLSSYCGYMKDAIGPKLDIDFETHASIGGGGEYINCFALFFSNDFSLESVNENARYLTLKASNTIGSNSTTIELNSFGNASIALPVFVNQLTTEVTIEAYISTASGSILFYIEDTYINGVISIGPTVLQTEYIVNLGYRLVGAYLTNTSGQYQMLTSNYQLNHITLDASFYVDTMTDLTTGEEVIRPVYGQVKAHYSDGVVEDLGTYGFYQGITRTFTVRDLTHQTNATVEFEVIII